jgi:acyl carrier protein
VKTDVAWKQALRDWIVAHNKRVGPSDFDDETPLIQQRIITSLQVLDLVLFLEELTGSPVDVEQLKPGTFHSVNAICATFGSADEGTT